MTEPPTLPGVDEMLLDADDEGAARRWLIHRVGLRHDEADDVLANITADLEAS